MEKDFYHLLGVTPSADINQIERAYYRQLAQVHRPDLAKSFPLLTAACKILADPVRRSQYDHLLNALQAERAPKRCAGFFSDAFALEKEADTDPVYVVILAGRHQSAETFLTDRRYRVLLSDVPLGEIYDQIASYLVDSLESGGYESFSQMESKRTEPNKAEPNKTDPKGTTPQENRSIQCELISEAPLNLDYVFIKAPSAVMLANAMALALLKDQQIKLIHGDADEVNDSQRTVLSVVKS